MIPGCGPNPAMIAQALYALLGVGEYKLSTKSVCDECTREKKREEPEEDPAALGRRRGREEVPVRAGLHLQRLRHEGRLWRTCPSAGAACRGCFGPCENASEQGSAMISAVASVYGLDDDPDTDLDKFVADVYDPIGNFYKYTLRLVVPREESRRKDGSEEMR